MIATAVLDMPFTAIIKIIAPANPAKMPANPAKMQMIVQLSCWVPINSRTAKMPAYENDCTAIQNAPSQSERFVGLGGRNVVLPRIPVEVLRQAPNSHELPVEVEEGDEQRTDGVARRALSPPVLDRRPQLVQQHDIEHYTGNIEQFSGSNGNIEHYTGSTKNKSGRVKDGVEERDTQRYPRRRQYSQYQPKHEEKLDLLDALRRCGLRDRRGA